MLTFQILEDNALAAQQIDPFPSHRQARPCELRFEGTFDGATLAIESSLSEGGTYVPHPDAAVTAPGVVVLWLVPGTWIKPTRASAGASTAVTLRIR